MKKSLNASGIKVDNFSIQEYNNNSVLTSENTTDLGLFLIPSIGVPGRTQDVTGYILTSATEDGKLEWTSGEQFGNVKGPSSSVNNALVRFDSTSGKLIKNSSVIVDDIGNMNIYGNLNVSNNFVLGNKITLSSGNPLSNYSLTLPVSVGSAGEVLKTDGLGQLYWSSSSGGGSPGGVNGSVQYNNNNTFGGDTNFEWISVPSGLGFDIQKLFVVKPGSSKADISGVPPVGMLLDIRNTVDDNGSFINIQGTSNSVNGLIMSDNLSSIPNVLLLDTLNECLLSSVNDFRLVSTGDIYIGTLKNLNFQNSSGTNYRWPTTNATANQVLSAGSTPGTMEWITVSSSGSPGGSNGSVQYNDNNTFGGDTNFSWDTLNQKLSVKGSIELKGSAVGEIGIYASSTTVSYDVILPPTQGNVNTFLQNDGTGVLSWTQGSISSGNLDDIQLSDGSGSFNSANLATFKFIDGNPTSYLTLGTENGETIIKGQDATTSSAVGSNLSIVGGSGGADANGGQISIVTGQGGSTSGDSGLLLLSTHDSSNIGLTGNISIITGNGQQSGSGFIDIITGTVSGTNNSSSGPIYIQTGESFGDDNFSGNIFIEPGPCGSKSDLSGDVFINGGFGKDGTRGGNVTITGGGNGDIISPYTAGNIIIKGGMGGGINQGGKVLIESGENNNVSLKTDTNIIFEVGSSQYTWPTTGATANQVLSSGSVPGIMEWIQQPTLVYALQAISIQDGVGSNNVDALNLQYLGIPGGTLYKRASTTAVLNNVDFPNFISPQEEYDPFGIRGNETTSDPSELNIVSKLGSGWYKISINVQHPYSNSLNIPVTNGGTNQSDQGNFCIGIKQGLTGAVPDSLDGQQVEWGFLDSSWLIPETAHYSAINKVNTDPLRFIMSANTVKTETFIIRIEIIKYT